MTEERMHILFGTGKNVLTDILNSVKITLSSIIMPKNFKEDISYETEVSSCNAEIGRAHV